MKILILSFYYPPDLCAGSFRAGAVVDALLKNLPDDMDIEVITTLPNRYNSFSVEAPEYESSERLTIHRIALPKHKSGMFDQAKAFISFMRQALKIVKNQKYQLIYGTSSRLMTATLSAYIAKKNSTRLYLDIRDIFADTMGDLLSPSTATFTKPLFEFIERWTITKALHVNLVSEGFSDYFTSRYPHQSFSYITNGIDDEFLTVHSNIVTRQTNKIKTFLYAGNIGEGQGLHKILPELSQLLGNNVRFRVIGDGGCKKELEMCLVQNKINNVELINPIMREDLILEYQKADVLFLHLNNYAAFSKVLPSKIFEYAAIGKPILAGVSGYSSEFIKSEILNAAVFEPCSARHAVEVIASLKFEEIDRFQFKEKYARINIMDKMSKDILLICKKEFSAS